MKQLSIIVFSCFFSCVLFAQDKKEKDELSFQNYFFEALKQKAIQNYDKAIENLEKCEEIHSNNTATLFEFSKNFLLKKQYSEAEEFIDRAIANEPKNIFLLAHKGKVLLNQRSYNRALKVYEELAKRKPTYNDYLVWLLMKQKKNERAKAVIEDAEKNAKMTSMLFSYKKKLYPIKKIKQEKQQEQLSSVEEIRKRFEEKTDFASLKKLLILEAEQKQYDKLLNDSAKGIELFPAQPYVYMANAMALNQQSNYVKALEVLQEGIDFVVDDKSLMKKFYQQMVVSYQGMKKFKKAQEIKQKIKKI